jgi:hypothetical protein
VLTRSFTLTTERSTGTLVALAILLGAFAIGQELVFDIPLKLPGHRALPGALALLVFAEAFAPLMIVLFAAIVSTSLLALGLGDGGPLIAAVWIGAALALFAMMHTRLRDTPWRFLLGGLAFGLLRYLSVLPGFHHTPELARIAGHLGFGLLGGLVAFALSRGLARKQR